MLDRRAILVLAQAPLMVDEAAECDKQEQIEREAGHGRELRPQENEELRGQQPYQKRSLEQGEGLELRAGEPRDGEPGQRQHRQSRDQLSSRVEVQVNLTTERAQAGDRI